MSYGYRVRLADVRPLQRVHRDATGSDTLEMELALLPILPPPQMIAALREALEAEGWSREADGSLSRTVDPRTRARLAADGSKIEVTSVATIAVVGHGNSQAMAEKNAESRAAEAAERAHRASTVHLARLERDVRAQVDAAIQRAYVVTLTERARALGDVQSIQEGTAADGTLEVTIKVKV